MSIPDEYTKSPPSTNDIANNTKADEIFKQIPNRVEKLE